MSARSSCHVHPICLLTIAPCVNRNLYDLSNEQNFIQLRLFARSPKPASLRLIQIRGARAPEIHQISSRAAIRTKEHSVTRSRVPKESELAENNSAALKESFRASLPLPSLLDLSFEDAPHHGSRIPAAWSARAWLIPPSPAFPDLRATFSMPRASSLAYLCSSHPQNG